MSDRDQRTEPATAKKRRDARERGEVRKSMDLNTAILMVLMISVLRLSWNMLRTHGTELFRRFFGGDLMRVERLSAGSIGPVLIEAVLQYFLMILPLLACALVGGVLAGTIGLRATLLVAAVGGAASVGWLLASPVMRIRSLEHDVPAVPEPRGAAATKPVEPAEARGAV